MKRAFLLVQVFCVLWSVAASGQLSVMPKVPQAGLVQRSQLWDIAVNYIGTEQPDIVVEMYLYNRISGSTALAGISAPVRLVGGAQQLSEASLGPINYSQVSSAITSSGLVMVGLYRVQYKLLAADQKTEIHEELELEIDVEPASPPLLSTPEDSAVLDSHYPQFSWLPPTPLSIFSNLTYDMVITEIQENQTATEAIERNSPVYSEGGLTNLALNYPGSALALDTGKYYAWQIIARSGLEYGAKSEVWLFSIAGAETTPTHQPAIFYPRLSKTIYDAIHPAGTPLRFEFGNENNEATAVLQISQMVDGGQRIIDTKSIPLKHGQNYVTWDVNLPSSSSKEELLTLKVLLPSGDKWGCVFRVAPTTN